MGTSWAGQRKAWAQSSLCHRCSGCCRQITSCLCPLVSSPRKSELQCCPAHRATESSDGKVLFSIIACGWSSNWFCLLCMVSNASPAKSYCRPLFSLAWVTAAASRLPPPAPNRSQPGTASPNALSVPTSFSLNVS